MKTRRSVAWSFSRYQVWRECAAKYNYRYNLKLPEPPSPPMERGNVIHNTLEKYVKLGGRGVKLGGLSELTKKHLTNIIKARNPRPELQLAFTVDWKQTGWFDPDVYCRVKVDVAYEKSAGVLDVVDYKSGKVKPEEHAEQLELYGLSFMILEPKLEIINTGVWYVDYEDEPRELQVYKRPFTSAVKRLKKSWDEKASGLINDTRFQPQPDRRKCGWCAYSCKTTGASGKPGPCKAAA